jgi:hypothetical protein
VHTAYKPLLTARRLTDQDWHADFCSCEHRLVLDYKAKCQVQHLTLRRGGDNNRQALRMRAPEAIRDDHPAKAASLMVGVDDHERED